MSLPAGTRLGPYEIVGALGAGGMGEVWRARDTRLARDVAIKVLPGHLAESAELRRRFEREAKTISQLSHPHICALFDVGREGETDYLVMELLEGEPLSRRLARGSLPLDQVCRYGAEIGEALGAAHAAGVVHRDLKPANVMVTKTGVKLLDFGLARPVGTAASTQDTEQLTASGPLTREGAVLGTLPYMAPEQLEGKDADARTDVFALGATLYEMAVGRRAFEGETPMAVASAILKSEPRPMGEVAPMAPPELNRLVRRCLAKDPEERWQSARDIAAELRFLRSEISTSGAEPPSARTPRVSVLRAVPWAIAAAAAALAATAWVVSRKPAANPARPVHLSLPTSPLALGVHPVSPVVAASPDGRRVAYVGVSGGKRQLYVRELDAPEARALPGTEGAEGPFFSPDGRMLGFWADEAQLKKVSVSGGPPELVAKGPTHIHGGSWCADGTIVYSSQRKIWRVAASGGEPKEVAAPREEGIRLYFPQFLPGCQAILYMEADSLSAPLGIIAQSLETGRRVTLAKGASNARFAPPASLLYAVNGTLMATRFDPRGLAATGPPVSVLGGVAHGAPQERGLAQFSVSEEGTLLFVSGPSYGSGRTRLEWVERDGTEVPIHEVGNATGPRLSPDGRRVVYFQSGEESGTGPRSLPVPTLWVYDVERGTTTRLTFEGGDWWPAWTRDGRRVLFVHSTDSSQKNFVLAWQSADGAGPLEVFSAVSGRIRQPMSWTPDGRTLLAQDWPWPNVSNQKADVVAIPREGERRGTPLLATPFSESLPDISPDGRWLAYACDESGRNEIYVRPYPGLDAKYQVSIDGGDEPLWSPRGGELFYRLGTKMMAVEIASEHGFRAGKPRLLFEAETMRGSRNGRDYDISADGRRFLMLKIPYAASVDRVSVVLNWPALLENR